MTETPSASNGLTVPVDAPLPAIKRAPRRALLKGASGDRVEDIPAITLAVHGDVGVDRVGMNDGTVALSVVVEAFDTLDGLFGPKSVEPSEAESSQTASQ